MIRHDPPESADTQAEVDTWLRLPLQLVAQMGRALAMMRGAETADGGGGGSGSGGGGSGGGSGGGGGSGSGGGGGSEAAAGAKAAAVVSRPPLLLRTAADKELIEAVQAAFRSRTSPGAPPNAQLMEAPQ